MLQSILGLLALGIATRFRLNGAYWRWRRETAFGANEARWPAPGRRRHAMLEYARWSWRMRRHLR